MRRRALLTNHLPAYIDPSLNFTAISAGSVDCSTARVYSFAHTAAMASSISRLALHAVSQPAEQHPAPCSLLSPPISTATNEAAYTYIKDTTVTDGKAGFTEAVGTPRTVAALHAYPSGPAAAALIALLTVTTVATTTPSVADAAHGGADGGA